MVATRLLGFNRGQHVHFDTYTCHNWMNTSTWIFFIECAQTCHFDDYYTHTNCVRCTQIMSWSITSHQLHSHLRTNLHMYTERDTHTFMHREGYTHTNTRTQRDMYTQTHTHACTQRQTCTHTHTHIHTHMHVQRDRCVHTHTHVHRETCTHTSTHTHVQRERHVHTQTHTHSNLPADFLLVPKKVALIFIFLKITTFKYLTIQCANY